MTEIGPGLLASPEVAGLLQAAVAHQSGRLLEWRLDHLDAVSAQSATATYLATVQWPYGQRQELLGVSTGVDELPPADSRTTIFYDGVHKVSVWLYPLDPDLPGLATAAYPDRLSQVFNAAQVLSRPITAEQLSLTMIGYRPRRRAVVKAVVNDPHEVFYIKVLRNSSFADVLRKHQLLQEAALPSPQIALTTPDYLLVLRELPGVSLTKALFEPGRPCSAEELIWLLDAMPSAVSTLPRRAPWSDAVGRYAQMIAATLPHLEPDLEWMSRTISSGLAGCPAGTEATHGDFHEGQLRVAGGRIVGVLDVDTIGPGRRADDLACLIGHVSSIQRMSPEQERKIRQLLAEWVPIFDQRVDPIELRLRAAGVIISLATGPYRSQEPDWQQQTLSMVNSALALVRQVA